MPDIQKIGNFIKQERERLNLSQDDIANKLGITRQAVSKWERGKCLPDKDIMTDLCEILEIKSNELLAGERLQEDNKGKIDNIGIDILITETNKRKRLLIISISIIIVTIISLLLFYFFKTYKKVEIYSVAGVTDNFHITDSLLTVTPDEVYLNISVIKPQKDITKIREVTLYYIKDNKEKIVSTNSCPNHCNPEYFIGTIIQRKGGDEYFPYNDLEYIKENLHLKIKYIDNEEVKEDIVKLDTYRLYVNNNLLFHHKDDTSDVYIPEDNKLENLQDKIKQKIIADGYTYEIEEETGNEVYIKNYDKDIVVRFYLNPCIITVTDYKKVDWYMYNYEDGELRYSNYNKDIKIGDSVLFNGELECEGDCLGHEERYKYYKEKYIDKIIDFK